MTLSTSLSVDEILAVFTVAANIIANIICPFPQAFGVQSLSGTGAIRLACEFLIEYLKYNVAYVSDPTWSEYDHLGQTDNPAPNILSFDSK